MSQQVNVNDFLAPDDVYKALADGIGRALPLLDADLISNAITEGIIALLERNWEQVEKAIVVGARTSVDDLQIDSIIGQR